MIGTGEHASQHGMNIGGIRHASDIKADDMTPQSQGMLHPQTGNTSWPVYLQYVAYNQFVYITNTKVMKAVFISVSVLIGIDRYGYLQYVRLK